jgi:uncharacterized ubiquitin-like protein YukD
MNDISVKILDVSGSKSKVVKMPDDVPIERIIVLLVEKLNLPINSPDGMLMSYKIHLRKNGMQLLDNQCLKDVDVIEGDELRLQPEITAG